MPVITDHSTQAEREAHRKRRRRNRHGLSHRQVRVVKQVALGLFIVGVWAFMYFLWYVFIGNNAPDRVPSQ